MMSKKQFFLTSLLAVNLLFISGCHYHFGQGELSETYSTISVPLICGDQKGELTADIIKAVSQSGAFQYVPSGGDLLLKIKLCGFEEEDIDYCYDRKRSGKLKKSTIPIQTRVKGCADVEIIDCISGKTLVGPTRIKASADFDHTYYATRNDVNVFSLGQLGDIDTARDAAMTPLNRNLAKAIVDFILSN